MKKTLTFSILSILFVFSSFAATRTTVQSGNYSDPNTWDCACIPAAGDIVRLEDGDTLTIDSNVTVLEFRYRFGENSTDASRLVVDSTLTISGDFRFEAPFFSNSTANVFVSTSGTIDVGDEFRILLSNNENNLTYNIIVDGVLDITSTYQHASGLLSTDNIVNLTVNGTMNCGNMSSTCSTDDSEFNLTVSGTFDVGNMSYTFNGNTSIYHAIFDNGSDADASNPTIIMNGQNSLIQVEVLSGGDFQASTHTYRLSSTSSGSKIDLASSDVFRGANLNFVTQGANDTLNLSVNGTGEIRSGTQIRGNSSGSENVQNIAVASGASLISVTNLRFDLAADGVFDFDNQGNSFTTLPNTYDFIFVAGNTVTGTFDNSGTMNYRDCRFTFGDENTFTFDQNGEISTTRNFDLSARADNVIDVNMNGSANFTGRYLSSTNGDNSEITTVISDSLVCGQLRMDVLTTAATADNVIDMTASGAVLSVTSIDMDNGVRDATISTATNGSTTTILRGGTTTDLPIRSSVDYDNLIISNTSGSGVTLDEGDLDNSNFHGDLTITSGATIDLNSTNSILVQGDFENAGTFQDNGQDLTVNGDFTNTFVFNNGGSDFTIGGNFLNSGTLNTLSASTAMNVTGNFTNSGTFDAEFATLDVNGNFSNTAAYTAAGSGNDINIAGNWNNTGTYTFVSGDVVTFDGSATQNITGNTSFYDLIVDNSAGGTALSITGGHDSIQNRLQIDDGAFNTQGRLTFLSNASGTAFLTDMTAGTGSITGDVTVERYLNKGNGWYLLGSPVVGTDLEDWNTELPMSGFTGSDEPANPWVSVYNYDETSRPTGGGNTEGPSDSGYVEATNTNQVIDAGEGWFVYYQNTKAAAPKASTTDVTGALRNGTVNVTASYSELYFPQQAENGWNLIANPYASPVDWSAVTVPTTIQNSGSAYRINAAGNYVAVTTSGSDQLSSGEGVWVQVGPITRFLNPGANATNNYTITFNESDKLNSSDEFNTRQANPVQQDVEPLYLRLTYSGNTSYEDVSEIRIDSNTTVFYDQYGDARKLAHSIGYSPNIASTTINDSVNEDLMWNSIPNNDNTIIPVRIWQKYPLNTNRDFTVTFDGIDEWTKKNKCLIMEDKLNNVTKSLNANDQDYTFNAMDTITAPYIFLTYMTPLDVSADDATCFGYNNGSASVQGLGQGKHDYIWVDAQNNIILNEKDKTGPSTVNNLMPGEYVIYVSDNGVCGEVAATIEITEPDPIIADFESDVDSVWMNANSTIFFSNGSINADDYHWDFGDGNTSDQENPAHTYTAGGTYTVKLVGITGPCSDTLSKTVVVFDNVGINEVIAQYRDPINIYQYNNETFVELNFNEATDATVSMFDVLGRNIIEPMKLINVTTRKERLDVPGNLMGVYTISVIAGDKKEAKKIYYTRR